MSVIFVLLPVLSELYISKSKILMIKNPMDRKIPNISKQLTFQVKDYLGKGGLRLKTFFINLVTYSSNYYQN